MGIDLRAQPRSPQDPGMQAAPAATDPALEERLSPALGVRAGPKAAATLVIEPHKPRTLEKLNRVRWPALAILALCCATALSFLIHVRGPQHQRHPGRAPAVSAPASCSASRPPLHPKPTQAKSRQRAPVRSHRHQRRTQAQSGAQPPPPPLSPTPPPKPPVGGAPAPTGEVPANAGQQRPQTQQGGPFSP
jgi:hypothetical protein